MKKAFTLFLILVLCFSLASCDPSEFRYDYDVMTETVISIELITYDNPECKKLSPFRIRQEDLKAFDFEKMTVVERLPDEKLDAFIKGLSDGWGFVFNDFDTPINGYNVKITYADGIFDILSVNAAFGCRYDKDGQPLEVVQDGLSSYHECVQLFETDIPAPEK